LTGVFIDFRTGWHFSLSIATGVKKMMTRKLMILTIFTLVMAAGAAQAGGDAAAGEAKAANCAGCHGAGGEGNTDNPQIAGMDEAEFVTAMGA
jgi:cytochrome c553